MPKLGAIISEEYLPYITDFGAYTTVKSRLELNLRNAKLLRGGYRESELIDRICISKRKFIYYKARHIICRDIGKVVFKTRELFWEYLLNPKNHQVIKTWHGEYGSRSFIKGIRHNEQSILPRL